MAYNNYLLTQKCVAETVNSWKLTRAHTGAIGVKGLIHRPEEVLDIQSELIFVNGMPRNETLVHQQLSLH